MATHSLTKNGNLQILDLIGRYAPRQYRTTGNPRSRYTMRCPLPGHNDSEHPDHSGSFAVNNEETLFYCFGCGGRGTGYQLQQLLSGVEIAPQPLRPPFHPLRHNAAQPSRCHQKQSPLQGATISDVAAAKGLGEGYLKDDLAWVDTTLYGRPAIMIPYFSEHKDDVQTRYRVGLNSDDRFRWAKGAKPRLYGIWELASIKKRDYVVLVEGETDYANMDFHGFSVLAAPGAQNFKPEWASLLAGIENIYAWEEPDAGGAAFVQRLAAHFPNLKVITPPEGIKDASDMAVKMGDRFADLMHELIDTAKQSEVGITVRRGANFTERRQSVAAAYEYGGDADTAAEILRCAVWRRAYQYGCGLVEGRTFHCGKRGCPNCTMVNLTRFFAEKMDIVEQISAPYLVEIPALYEVRVRELGQEKHGRRIQPRGKPSPETAIGLD